MTNIAQKYKGEKIPAKPYEGQYPISPPISLQSGKKPKKKK